MKRTVHRFKYISRLGLLLLCVSVLVSCEDKEEGTPADLYQEYQVLVTGDNAAAFANLRKGGPSGERVKAAADALTVNTLPMYYTSPSAADDPEFTYFTTLPENHRKAIFRFKNSSGKVLENVSEYGSVHAITLIDPSVYGVSAGQIVELSLNGASLSDVKAYLTGTSALSSSQELTLQYPLDFSALKAEIVLPQKDAGVYDLIVDNIVEAPVTAGDGTAGGKITTIVRTRKPLKYGD